MIVFYYRDRATGEITQMHGNNQNWTAEEARQRVADYNRHCIHQTADMMEIEEGSFVEYLFNKAMRTKPSYQRVEAVLEHIREAEQLLLHLEDCV